MQLTPRGKRVIELAYDEARQLNHKHIGPEHLLLGLIREGEGLAGRVLKKLGVDLDRTRREVIALQDAEPQPGRQAPPGRRPEPIPPSGVSLWLAPAVGTLRALSGRRTIELAVDAEAFQLLVDVFAAKDSHGHRDLRDSQRVFVVPDESAVRRLAGEPLSIASVDPAFSCVACKVEILDGAHAGRLGWAPLLAFVKTDEVETDSAPSPDAKGPGWGELTECGRRALVFAQEIAARLGSGQIAPDHLFLGIARDENSLAARVLDHFGDDVASLRSLCDSVEDRPVLANPPHPMRLTPRARQALDLAYAEAMRLRNKYIGTEHLLLGLLRADAGLSNAEMDAVRAAVERIQSDRAMPAAMPAAGARGTLRAPTGRRAVEVAVDAQAFDQLVAAYSAKDAHGYRELRDAGRVLLVADGVAVQCRAANRAAFVTRLVCKIEVLDGPYAGRTGWVSLDAFVTDAGDVDTSTQPESLQKAAPDEQGEAE
jgi:hypothetical protein